VAHDLMALCADLAEIGVDSDGLAWFGESGAIPPGVLADLIGRGSAAGMATVLATTDVRAAECLADESAAVVMHRMTDPVAAERFAKLTGEKLTPGEQGVPGNAVSFVRRPAVAPETLCTLADGEFVLAVKAPRRRLVPLGRVIPARIAAEPAPIAAERVPRAPDAPAMRWARPREPFGSKDGHRQLAGALHDPERRR
jgi:hypothetical protein